MASVAEVILSDRERMNEIASLDDREANWFQTSLGAKRLASSRTIAVSGAD
jgi:hypothetical protein